MFRVVFSRLLVFGFAFVFLAVVFTLGVYAEAPRRYYDWSSTLETNNLRGLGVVSAVLGESTPSGQVDDYQKFNNYFLVGNLAPDNPLYFLKTAQENMRLAFTYGSKEKEELRLAIAGERLKEIGQMAAVNKPQALSLATDFYGRAMENMASSLENLKKQGYNVDDLLKKIEEETAKHTVVLEEAAIKAPDRTRDTLERAVEANWKGIDVVADLAGKPAVPSDVVDRLSSLKAQGLLTEEEVNKLINVKSRTEAREEIKKYVGEGIVPESDFLRLNENVKQIFPDEFFKLHEIKRFNEMRKLETERPDDATLKRIQEFAKSYKPGEVVPSDIRKYWVPVIRLEEIQNTLRPDLIDESLIKSNQEDYKKFTEIVERFKPRPEDVVYLENYLKQNPNASLPPEYERMMNLGRKYGAQCGSGFRWESSGSQSGGACVPNDFKASDNQSELPKVGGFAEGKACSGAISAAKGPGGVCSAFPVDCIPQGWSKTSTCVEVPGNSRAGIVGANNGGDASRSRSCPSNSHWVPVFYMPEGGYCIPNYTPITTTSSVNQVETVCPSGYYRSYSGGPCLSSTWSDSSNLSPLTTTPGGYPNPLYPSYGECGQGYHWSQDRANLRGGYCAPDAGSGSNEVPSGGECPAGQYRGPGGNCVSKDGSDGAKVCPSGQYMGPGGNCILGGGDRSCATPVNGCGFGAHWNQERCSCQSDTIVECTKISCPSGQYFDSRSCVCRSGGDYPTSCTYPSTGCGSGKYWDGGSCSCKTSPTPTNTGSGGSGSGSSGGYIPPSGYGSCLSGQYWNGSSCVTPSNTNSSPDQACRNTGGSWNGSTCVMSSSSSPGGSSDSPSQPASQPTSQPASPIQPAPSQPVQTSQPQTQPQTQTQPEPPKTQPSP